MKIHALFSPISSTLADIASDKSISHRCAIFSLLSDKTSVIKNYLFANDTKSSLKVIQALGAKVEIDGSKVFITPPSKITEPSEVLDCGNSGTTIRLMLGFLSSVDGFFVMSGDKYLNKRPMKRVTKPLSEVGAKFDGVNNGEFAPISVRGHKLKHFEFESRVSSAQVKTAMILAGLQSRGCIFKEPSLSRDHSERILRGMGADIKYSGDELEVLPLKSPLNPLDITVPNDPSSAFYLAVAAAITPNSKITLKNILLNKTRTEAYKVLQKMGTKISVTKTSSQYEDIGDIIVEYAPLKAVDVSENISWLIDEAPALAIAFACANGVSSLKNATELRVKECDRIKVVVDGLRACGIKVDELDDGFVITGGTPNAAIIDPSGDHRIAMSFAVLGLKCGMIIENSECIAVSFPNFGAILRQIGASIED
ncbi:MAG: 3-phosphoshikimate 1-carboxyvinyltransferase [Campylobacter sp.]|nr:3-phosphoshikimate 1-carboxyvinyltransferase [Campylobacter sp.]